jgi:hypothetical protein
MSEKPPPRSDDYKPERRNAQTDQPQGKHSPEEFDSQNPAKQVKHPGDTGKD